jgi:hypothetical protein
MCYSQDINYALCGCKIRVATFCPKPKEPPNLWRRVCKKPITACQVSNAETLYLDCWCYRCGHSTSQTRRNIADNWAAEKARLRSERAHLPMPAFDHMNVTFPENSLPLWEQRIRWRKSEESGMIMQRCRTCGKGPFLSPAEEREFCCNETCATIKWEDWQGFSDTPIEPRNHCSFQIGIQCPNGVYLCYHTENGMTCAPKDHRRGLEIQKSHHTDSARQDIDSYGTQDAQEPATIEVVLPNRPALARTSSHQTMNSQGFQPQLRPTLEKAYATMPRIPTRPVYQARMPLRPLITERGYTAPG